MHRTIFILALLISTTAQADDILESYIQEGLQSNLALKQQDFILQQNLQALHEVRGSFLPSISLEARYSRAGGGRDINIPIGDLINPVHQTLNQLLGQSVFPNNLPNEHIRFLREEEHDTKLRLVQPIFQPKIYRNRNIKHAQADIQRAARNAFARELVRDIKTAYYNHLKSVHLVSLLNDTQNLLDENLRVSQKLVEADKATADVVYRARAELAELHQQQTEARRDSILSAAYFNFLLNR
ncbi:MAG: TolC family protein, partial [Candidatus Latescibacteria bacterium]|nr:TolC family protein [Candidatus Latescibacterota bacterium]